MLRGVLFALLVCSSLLLSGCTIPLLGDDEVADSETNEPPSLSVNEVQDAGFGEPVLVSGVVSDESPSEGLVTMAFSIPWGNIYERPESDGSFSYSMNGLEPGDYSVTVSVKDSSDLLSESITHNFTVHTPEEAAAVVTVWRSVVYFETGERSSFSGEVEHLFLDSCSFAYTSSGDLRSSDLTIQYNSGDGMFNIGFPPLSDTEIGILSTSCGRYTTTTTNVSLTLNLIVEEAPDADGDGIADEFDSCPVGESFVSSNTTDYDSDGCYDINEDSDDDNDGVTDFADKCRLGLLGWLSGDELDYDGDGCNDAVEDEDDDSDSITDDDDLCDRSPSAWRSTFSNDHDRDGCRDSDEDTDDDNDGVLDAIDLCPKGVVGWLPDILNDRDGDGCRDADEDDDDDNDGVTDEDDLCGETAANHAVNLYGCAEYEWDSDGDGIMDDADLCENTPNGLPVNEQGCADIDNDGVFANADACPDSQQRWTVDASGCTVLQYPVGWSQGQYSTEPLGRVGPMDIQTTDGLWRIENEWDGNSTYLFIFNYKSSSYMSSLWNQDVGGLLDSTPNQTVVFFGSFDSDFSADINGMRNRVDNWLSSQSQEVQDSWSGRIKYVNERAWNTGGSINAVINDWNAFYYGIDRFQRWRQIGSLLDWSQGNTCCYRLDYLANEPIMWAKEFPVVMRGQDPAVVSVDIAVGERHSGGWGSGYTTLLNGQFPNASTMASFNTMEVYLEHSCSQHRDRYGIDDDSDGQVDRYGGCHEWDYLHYLKICDENIPSSCGAEFVRYITTYGREGRWLTDISPLLWMVNNGGNRNFTYQGANGGWLNITLFLSTWDDDGLRPVHGEFAFSGGKFNSDYNNESKYTRRYPVNSTTRWEKVEIAAIVTGHGFGNDPNNCAEFCNHEHRFSMNGFDVTHDFPMAGNSSTSSDQEGCKRLADEGVVANQFGSWPYGRAGWCPGQDVPPALFDITAWVNWSRSNSLLYQGLWDGQQYGETSNDPNIRALIWVVYYVNTSGEGLAMAKGEPPPATGGGDLDNTIEAGYTVAENDDDVRAVAARDD